MAKGNLLLGTAGNSVGDVVMYRREGAQVSRVRVRKVKNPKTAAQSTQRAFFAPVAKFYSPLAVVLERSFEGLSRSKSYSKFLKTNVDLARQNDWLLPKGTGFFPLPYKLSQGTLPSINYVASDDYTNLIIKGGTVPANVNTDGQLSQYLVSLGAQNGDVVTFIIIEGANANDNFVPHAFQLEVDTTQDHTLAGLFPGYTWTPNVEANDLIIGASFGIAGGAVIIARFENDKWRRSTQFLEIDDSLASAIATDNYKAAAIASYGMNAGDPNPLVYLDGDTLEG